MKNPITDRKLRIAIIGCGRIAKNHFGSLDKHRDDLELVAVCDTNPAA
jgi:UDP-N-acetyl-2-amino-2-deoxyglucuronate dehydrogenase